MGGERRFRVLVISGKDQKSFRRKLVVFAYENWKNTKKHVFEMSEKSQSQRLYNGVMLKVPPTKGHKESR